MRSTLVILAMLLSAMPACNTERYRVTFTGHSLGEGLASAAIITSGFTGSTFNASGLNRSTLKRANGTEWTIGSYHRFDTAFNYIARFYVSGEPLTAAQTGSPLPVAIGGHFSSKGRIETIRL